MTKYTALDEGDECTQCNATSKSTKEWCRAPAINYEDCIKGGMQGFTLDLAAAFLVFLTTRLFKIGSS